MEVSTGAAEITIGNDDQEGKKKETSWRCQRVVCINAFTLFFDDRQGVAEQGALVRTSPTWYFLGENN